MRNKKSLKYSLIVVLTIILIASVSGQMSMPSKPPKSGETLQLFTDRGLYCVSERIYFSAFYRKPTSIINEELSTVLYAELIRHDGTKLAGSKVRIKEKIAAGFLTIPDNIPSGIYYLRVYTLWMRNYSPYTYTYLPVKIVNPYLKEIDTGPETSIEELPIENKKEPEITEELLISGLQNSYKPRQLVELELSLNDDRFSGPYCLSVTRLGSDDASRDSYNFSDLAKTNPDDKVKYLPENKYLSISGKIVNQQTKEPLGSEQVMLSSTLDPFYYSVNESDSSGSFLFLLPDYEGSHQFCLTASYRDNTGFEFLVNNDFCNQPVSLPYLQFDLTQEEKKSIKEICTDAQLQNKFNPVDSNLNKPDKYYPFYGKASEIVYVKDYIELQDLREFLFELVTELTVVRKSGEWNLKLVESGSFSALPPLILMDNIPVQNNAMLLGIPTKEIERIEVINGGYIVGKTFYSGIVSIFSNKRNLAGLDLKNNIQFFNYQLFQENKSFVPFNEKNISGRSAEMLNLLYWQPSLNLSKNSPAKISFYTSDALGKYVVTIRSAGDNESTHVIKQLVFSCNY
jgi:hypothetical protein